MNIIGLISGSSLDGLDMALCHFEGRDPGALKWSCSEATTVSFDESLVTRLATAISMNTRELLKLEVDFSEFCAKAVNDLKDHLNIKIDYVASHGHTVFHYPEEGYTLQIGKGSILAERTGIPSIVDFRSNDVALKGEGAPVAPIVEQYLYPGHDFYFNLGGIANVSLHHGDQIVSLDSSPCNQVLNHIMNGRGKAYDDKGSLAKTGTCSNQLMKAWSELPYFSKPFPKSMDNSWVKEVFMTVIGRFELSDKDVLATMVEFTASQLKSDCKLLSDGHNIGATSGFITGGGAFNDYLIDRMKVHCADINLSLTKPDSQTVNFKEAILMALMGYLRAKGIANTIPTVTGAQSSTIGGAIYTV